MVRSGKAARSARGGALEVRRTSDARSNAAGARQGLPSDPRYTNLSGGRRSGTRRRGISPALNAAETYRPQ